MRTVAAGVCVLLLALVSPALAQRTTGSIVGTATDESGGVLPGVTVTLQGNAAEAIDLLRTAVAVQPANAEARQFLNEALAKKR